MNYTYRLTGRVDSLNANDLERDIFAEYEKNGELTIDASELSYISSAGLRVLLKLRRFIERIPEKDSMVHGDFHTNNIMVQGDELLIIDMAEISYGNPIYDLSSAYYVHVMNAKQHPDQVMRYLNVTPEIAIKLWDVIMKVYFHTEDSDKIDRYNRIIENFCLLKSALIPAIWVNMPNEHKARATEAAKAYLFPQMDVMLEDLNELLESLQPG